jgi:hypothetical protein
MRDFMMTMATLGWLLLLGSVWVTPVTAAQNMDNRRRRRTWLTACVATADNRTDFVDCIRERGDMRCLNRTEAAEIEECVAENRMPGASGNSPNRIEETVAFCTTDYVQCARDRLKQDVGNLPSCVRESMRNLASCAMNNTETCGATCRAARNETEAFRLPPGLAANGVRTCPAIRRAILRPLCRRAACCPACFEALEDVGLCFLNQVLKYTPEPCEMSCEALIADDERRELQASFRNALEEETEEILLPFYDEPTLSDRWLQETDDQDVIYENCAELAPGVNPDLRNAAELAERSDFFDCVVDEVYTVLIEGDDDSTTPSPVSAPSASRGPLGRRVVGAILTLALFTYGI